MEAGAGTAPPETPPAAEQPPAEQPAGDETAQQIAALNQRIDSIAPPAEQTAPAEPEEQTGPLADRLAAALAAEEPDPEADGQPETPGQPEVYWADDGAGNMIPVDANGYPIGQPEQQQFGVDPALAQRIDSLEGQVRQQAIDARDESLGALAEEFPQLKTEAFAQKVADELGPLAAAAGNENLALDPRFVRIATESLIAREEQAGAPTEEVERATVESGAGPSQPEQDASYSQTRGDEIVAASKRTNR